LFPNTYVLNNRVSTTARTRFNRVSVRIGIAYKESIGRAREVILGLTRGRFAAVRTIPRRMWWWTSAPRAR
jgi:hypothetical protein